MTAVGAGLRPWKALVWPSVRGKEEITYGLGERIHRTYRYDYEQ